MDRPLTRSETALAGDVTNTTVAAEAPMGCAMAWFSLKTLRGQPVTRDRVARLAELPSHHARPAVLCPPSLRDAAPDIPVNAIDAERLTRVPLIRRAVNSCLGAMRSPDHGGDAA